MAKRTKGLLAQYSAEGGGQDPSRRSAELDHTNTGRGSVLYVDVYQEVTMRDLAAAILAALGAKPIHTIH